MHKNKTILAKTNIYIHLLTEKKWRVSSALVYDKGLVKPLLPWAGQMEVYEKNVLSRRKMSKNNAIFA
ncbi:hypothetical protein HMPREF0650_0217 [Hoylesella buccalis ATCC 35310]|uniref:Uncharacterized protein n=1 Tax=Hoylesella buccalis ATCC 35310 TaxID=679190 RepID=D1W8T8_9BACT|nr:hypothetical protein HMPREF0650_0217 [Hoylesella buccalis ATCC 35310]